MLNDVQNINSINSSCTGCGSCVGACPVSAIKMQENSEGFLYPNIDKELCINCGKCLVACPIHSYSKTPKPKACYAATIKDDKTRKNSSSGGVFVALAKWTIENGGYVCGAVYNKDFKVEHILSNTQQDILKMQGSKYVQSDLKDCFQKIENTLSKGDIVLFVGTPCQVAGLTKYLKTKNVDRTNLYTCDLICYGTPSPKVLKKYLEEFIPQDEKISSINMRKRINKNSCFSVVSNKQEYCYPHGANDKGNIFIKLFFKNICLRKSCSDCHFTNTSRVGDITLGDFWGIQKYNKKLDPASGISCVLINTTKGEELLLRNRAAFDLLKSIPIDIAIEGQPRLRFPTQIPEKKREVFFDNLDKMALWDNFDQVFGDKSDCKIINYWFAVNYGASLTCYALKNFIEKMGYSVKTINFVDDKIAIDRNYHNSKAKIFAEKYLNLTSECQDYSSLIKLNSNTDFFVVGSDQVWRPSLYKIHGGEIYQLSFVNDAHKKIAFAASFGATNFDGNEQDKKTFKSLIDRFDAISVREKDGLSILKNEFNIRNGELIIDPIFTLKKEDLDLLTKHRFNDETGYIGVFKYLYNNHKDWCSEFENQIGKNNNVPIKIYRHSNDCDIEEFICFIKECKILITDSFHAACIAIIFQKPFIILGLAENVISRMQSLIETFKLDKRILIEKSDILSSLAFEKAQEFINIKYDYVSIGEIIKKETQRMEKWFKLCLKSSPSAEKTNKNSAFEEITQYMLTKEKELLRKNTIHLIKKMPQTILGFILLKIYIHFNQKNNINTSCLNKKQLYSNRVKSLKKNIKKLISKK